MKNMRWNDLAELIGMVAIIIGLYFVYEELRLGGAIARAEMSNEANLIFAELDQQERDPAFAGILVKAETNPEQLTRVERVQLDAYYRRVLHAYAREKYYYRRGIFPEWTSPIRRTAPRYFGSGYGRAWWNARRTFFISSTRSEVAPEVDRSLEQREAIEYYQRFDSEVTRQLGKDQASQ